MSSVAGLLELLLAIAAFLVLGWFLWWVFLRRYFRIVRIRHARERREMEEAVRRHD